MARQVPHVCGVGVYLRVGPQVQGIQTRQPDAMRGDPITTVVATLTIAPMRDRSLGPHGQLCDNFHP